MNWHRSTDWILSHWHCFRFGDAGARGPWKPGVRTAVLRPWFPVWGKARVFEEFAPAALLDYGPELIAGPAPLLRRLAEIALTGREAVPNPERGFVALGGIGRAPVAQRDRDLLWQAFGAPLSEELRDWTGGLLAFECEAHSGLHLTAAGRAIEPSPESGELQLRMPEATEAEPVLLPTGLAAAICEEPCVCGRSSPRLVNLHLHSGYTAPVMALAG